MEIALTLSALPSFEPVIKILTVAFGLGMVIFLHELGHFAVAKWCGVFVERFSIGFGPILWSFKKGDTEYALSAIPFGGYVKMMGQDDADPSQLTDEKIAADPRSYSAKAVWQRMAIISAGVTMNLISGFLIFMTAFYIGVEIIGPRTGNIQVGMPAWQQGLREGDDLSQINGEKIEEFTDLMRGTALTSGDVRVEGKHSDGSRFDVTVKPEQGDRRRLGVGPPVSLKVYKPLEKGEIPYALPGTPAAESTIEPGDQIVACNGQEVTNKTQLNRFMADHRRETVELTVARKSKKAENGQETLENAIVKLAPARFRRLGIRMDVGKIYAIRLNSPAENSGLLPGDKISKVDGHDIGQELDPLMLPDYFSDRQGQTVTVTISREKKGGAPDIIEKKLTPEDLAAWSEPPVYPDSPLSIPSIGIAFHLIPKVSAIVPNSPADKQKIQPHDTIVEVAFVRQSNLPVDGEKDDTHTLKIGETNWAHAFWVMQELFATRKVVLTVKDDNDKVRTVEIQPEEATEPDWWLPTCRGITFSFLVSQVKAHSLGESAYLARRHTQKSILEIYMTLRSLFRGHLSIKNFSGPIGIGRAAYDSVRSGLERFIMFLGMISINLAVVNFLPIPVLDGGHMVLLLWEAIARRKPSERVVTVATYLGILIVLSLMLTVITLDVWGLFVKRD